MFSQQPAMPMMPPTMLAPGQQQMMMPMGMGANVNPNVMMQGGMLPQGMQSHGIPSGVPMQPMQMNPMMMGSMMHGWWTQPSEAMTSTMSSGSWNMVDKGKGKGKHGKKGSEKVPPAQGKGKHQEVKPKKSLPKAPVKGTAPKKEQIPDDFDEGPVEDPPDWGGDDDGDGDGGGGSECTYSYEEDELGEEETVTNDPTLRSSALTSREPSHAGDDRPPLPRRRREEGPAQSPEAPRTKARTATKSRPPTQPGSIRSNRGSATPSEGSAQTSVLRDLLTRNVKKTSGGDRGGGKSVVSSIKVETFKGSRSHYRDWKKTLQVQRGLYKLSDPEMAALVYLSTAGEPRDIVNQLEIEELQEEAGFARVMRLLDDTYDL